MTKWRIMAELRLTKFRIYFLFSKKKNKDRNRFYLIINIMDKDMDRNGIT